LYFALIVWCWCSQKSAKEPDVLLIYFTITSPWQTSLSAPEFLVTYWCKILESNKSVIFRWDTVHSPLQRLVFHVDVPTHSIKSSMIFRVFDEPQRSIQYPRWRRDHGIDTTNSPRVFTKAPPLFPGLTAASVWMKEDEFRSCQISL
jgi:hypothetical protein